MTRRLTLAIVATVAGALVLAGLGTLLLVQLSARRETGEALRRQAEALAPTVDAITRLDQLPRRMPSGQGYGRRRLEQLGAAFKLQGVEVVNLATDGTVVGVMPPGVSVNDLNFKDLAAGRSVWGSKGNLVYAAAPVRRPSGGITLVILTRSADNGLQSGGRWFVVAVVVTLFAAVVVGSQLGSTLTRPVRAAEETTRRIAAGDMSARVRVPEGDDELAALARSINAMASELERSRGAERKFLLLVSHDLRTPLTSIRGYAEALIEGTAPDPDKAAGVILTEARRLERLVRDLLDLAKLESKRFSLDFRPTDMAEVVTEIAEGFEPAAVEAGVTLELDVQESARAPAHADPDRLAQVVANLMENALKYARTRITVGAAGSDAALTLWVSDDGPGLALEDLERAFERIYASPRPPTRSGVPGSGLGLAIVRELVEAMGGSVRAEPAGQGDGTATQGTRILVTLRKESAAAVNESAGTGSK